MEAHLILAIVGCECIVFLVGTRHLKGVCQILNYICSVYNVFEVGLIYLLRSARKRERFDAIYVYRAVLNVRYLFSLKEILNQNLGIYSRDIKLPAYIKKNSGSLSATGAMVH